MSKWSDIELGKLNERELLLLTAQRVNDIAEHVSAQNGRVCKLEQWRDKAIGALLIVSIVVSTAISLAIAFFKG
jgi:hypothetical protein